MSNEVVVEKKELFSTCGNCVVKKWCKLRSGEVKLPPDYGFLDFCVGHDMLEKAMELSRIPKEYRNANLHNYKVDTDNKEHAESIKYFMSQVVDLVETGSNIAFIHHNKGTGKSWSSVGILNEFIYKTCRNPKWFDYENPPALYVKFGTWANDVRNIYTKNDADHTARVHKELQQMKEVHLLVLDDIGSGRITPIIRDLLYDVIDYRKEELKSTIYTSNFADTILSQDDYLGEIIVSRILYNCAVFELGGRNRRSDKTLKK